MSTASTTDPVPAEATSGNRTRIRGALVGGGVATLANAALWVGGRAADASFVASPPVGDTTMTVGIALVVVTTVFAFAAGWGALVIAARRSQRSVRAVVVGAALVAVASAPAPPVVADDTASGVLLAAMHIVTGTAFVVAAVTAGPR
jgi:hypothetical protein